MQPTPQLKPQRILLAEFVRDQVDNLVGSGVLIKGIATATIIIVIIIIFCCSRTMQGVSGLVEDRIFGLLEKFGLELIGIFRVHTRGFGKVVDPIGTLEKIIAPCFVFGRVGPKGIESVAFWKPILLDEPNHGVFHTGAFFCRAKG